MGRRQSAAPGKAFVIYIRPGEVDQRAGGQGVGIARAGRKAISGSEMGLADAFSLGRSRSQSWEIGSWDCPGGTESNPQCRERAYVIYFHTGGVDQRGREQGNVIDWLGM